MDPSHVLIALKEQGKWRERRKRLEERLRQIRSRKRYFARELEAARGKVSQFSALLASVRREGVEIRTRIPGAGSPR